MIIVTNDGLFPLVITFIIFIFLLFVLSCRVDRCDKKLELLELMLLITILVLTLIPISGQIFSSKLIQVVEQYQILTDSKLIDFQQLKEPFNTKDGKYHEPLLIYADFSGYVLEPEDQRIKFTNIFKKPMFVIGDSARYHTDTPWGINTFILEKYDTSFNEEIPICQMSKKDITELLMSFYQWSNWVKDNTAIVSKQAPAVLRFKISELKFNNSESVHILIQNEDIDLREFVEIRSIKYTGVDYPILEIEEGIRGGVLILPEKMKDYIKY